LSGGREIAHLLPDGRRLRALYNWSRDWWLVNVEGGEEEVSEGRSIYLVLRDLLDIPPGPTPDWLIEAAEALPLMDTPLGRRARCRCCGNLTLSRYGHYEICPVCRWEDDPTTIFEPGERPGGPGPNHVSLREGRANLRDHGISKPWLAHRVDLRDPLAVELPDLP
jgi:Cysteine-rich CPCC